MRISSNTKPDPKRFASLLRGYDGEGMMEVCFDGEEPFCFSMCHPEEVWRQYLDRFPPSWDSWFEEWVVAYPDRRGMEQKWEKLYLEESWKRVFRCHPIALQGVLHRVVRLFADDGMTETGHLLNIIMDTCPQKTLEDAYRVLGDFFRERGMNVLACVFYSQLVDGMKTIEKPGIQQDMDIVSHGISHFYLRYGSRREGMKQMDRVVVRTLPIVSYPISDMVTQLQYWYHPRLSTDLGAVRSEWDVSERMPAGFFPSSCSVVGSMGILRSVNYQIVRENGSYIFDGTVQTRNFWVTVDPMTAVCRNDIREMIIPARFRRRESHIRGLEDMRLFTHDRFPEKWYALATSFDHGKSEGRPSQVFCVFSAETLEMDAMYLLDYQNQDCQKNWVPFVLPDQHSVGIIYGWNPYTILTISIKSDGHPVTLPDHPDEAEIRVWHEQHQHRIRTEPFRGSTSPVLFGDEWHVIVHEVYYTGESPTRKYRHRVVRLSLDCRHIMATTCPFVFEDNQIEYTIGFTTCGDFVLLHYSVWDNHARMLSIPIHRWTRWVRENSVS